MDSCLLSFFFFLISSQSLIQFLSTATVMEGTTETVPFSLFLFNHFFFLNHFFLNTTFIPSTYIINLSFSHSMQLCNLPFSGPSFFFLFFFKHIINISFSHPTQLCNLPFQVGLISSFYLFIFKHGLNISPITVPSFLS